VIAARRRARRETTLRVYYTSDDLAEEIIINTIQHSSANTLTLEHWIRG
jgi:hypothetical protein